MISCRQPDSFHTGSYRYLLEKQTLYTYPTVVHNYWSVRKRESTQTTQTREIPGRDRACCAGTAEKPWIHTRSQTLICVSL